MKKIAMLGGSFDPIHRGHVMLGQTFAEYCGLDKVLIIPTRTSPHKQASETPAEHRLEMCRLAAEYAGEKFEASDIELKREGLSYSFYTIVSLHERYPDSEIYLLTGADMFVTLETWHRFDELKELAVFCTVPRGDITVQMLREKEEMLQGLGCRTCVCERMLMQVSSTEIRKRAAAGESVEDLVPLAVSEYILANGLYSE